MRDGYFVFGYTARRRDPGRIMKIQIEPIGDVEAVRPHAEDDFWGGEEARIALARSWFARPCGNRSGRTSS
jgi:hypothetical protein